MKMPIPSPAQFRAVFYQQYSAGFAAPIGAPAMPGPILQAEVGDTLVVHFRNGDHHFDQAHTMHPHGVKYTPDYDGSYLSNFTRAGGFIAPVTSSPTPGSACPARRGCGRTTTTGRTARSAWLVASSAALIIREKGAKVPDVEQVLVLHQLAPQITHAAEVFQCFNGRAFAGNTPTIRAKVGQDVALHAYGGDACSTPFTSTGTAG